MASCSILREIGKPGLRVGRFVLAMNSKEKK
jgi:hypothetical protein